MLTRFSIPYSVFCPESNIKQVHEDEMKMKTGPAQPPPWGRHGDWRDHNMG